MRPLLALGLVLLAATSLTGYTLSTAKWHVSSVSYYVNPVSNDLSPEDAIAGVRASADAWQLQSGANLALVYAGTTTGASLTRNNRNEVFFRGTHTSYVARTYSWWNSSGQRLESDIVFYDDSARWFVGSGCVSGSGANRGAYVESHGTHEFGHLQGLGHSTVSGATMYSRTGQCSRAWASLHSDDIAGIRFLYPPQ